MNRAGVLLAAVIVLSTSGYPQDGQPKAAPELPAERNKTSCGGDPGRPLDILSDMRGVDFKPYLNAAFAKIKKNWYALMPAEARPPISDKGKVSLRFEVMPDGHVDGLRFVTRSGNPALDRAAYDGITASNPLSPLPFTFTGPYLELCFNFAYNLDQRELSSALRKPIQDAHAPTAPIVLFAPPPQYTKRAIQEKEEGSVLLSLTVDKHGKAKNIRVLKSLSPDLDEKAIRTVKKWEFKAAMKDGQPVAADMNVEVPFRLN